MKNIYYFLIYFISFTYCQLYVNQGLLLINSSYNRQVLSLTISYTGTHQFSINFYNQQQVIFIPQGKQFKIIKNQTVQFTVLFNLLESNGQYWYGLKTQSFRRDQEKFIEAKINDHNVLIPKFRYPLQIIHLPLESVKPCQFKLFLINSFQHSFVYYAPRIIQSIRLFLGNKQQIYDSITVKSSGSNTQKWDENSKKYKSGTNSWGKSWLLSQNNHSIGKSGLIPFNNNILPNQILSIVKTQSGELRCIFKINNSSFNQLTLEPEWQQFDKKVKKSLFRQNKEQQKQL